MSQNSGASFTFRKSSKRDKLSFNQSLPGTKDTEYKRIETPEAEKKEFSIKLQVSDKIPFTFYPKSSQNTQKSQNKIENSSKEEIKHQSRSEKATEEKKKSKKENKKESKKESKKENQKEENIKEPKREKEIKIDKEEIQKRKLTDDELKNNSSILFSIDNIESLNLTLITKSKYKKMIETMLNTLIQSERERKKKREILVSNLKENSRRFSELLESFTKEEADWKKLTSSSQQDIIHLEPPSRKRLHPVEEDKELQTIKKKYKDEKDSLAFQLKNYSEQISQLRQFVDQIEDQTTMAEDRYNIENRTNQEYIFNAFPDIKNPKTIIQNLSAFPVSPNEKEK